MQEAYCFISGLDAEKKYVSDRQKEKMMGEKTHIKESLLNNIHQARVSLEKKYADLTPQQMIWPGSMDDWSVKDILAHLVDWEQRFISWYKAGKKGETPETPAPGMTWKDLPELNKRGYEVHKNDSLADVLDQYGRSYQEILDLIESMNEEEITQPGVYGWTGDSALLTWIAANTSKHYGWAVRNIRTTVIKKGCPAKS